jgi:hypothetical protein
VVVGYVCAKLFFELVIQPHMLLFCCCCLSMDNIITADMMALNGGSLVGRLFFILDVSRWIVLWSTLRKLYDSETEWGLP